MRGVLISAVVVEDMNGYFVQMTTIAALRNWCYYTFIVLQSCLF